MKAFLFRALKKAGAILAGFLAFLFLTALFLSICSRPWYYRLLYFGDRVSGTVRLVVDGETVPLEKEDFQNLTAAEEKLGSKLKVRPQRDGGARVSFRAGSYGSYCFSLRIEGADEPLELTAYQYNWWNVCRFDLEIRVDRAAGTVEYSCNTRTLSEEGRFRTEYIPEEACRGSLEDRPLKFCMLSV